MTFDQTREPTPETQDHFREPIFKALFPFCYYCFQILSDSFREGKPLWVTLNKGFVIGIRPYVIVRSNEEVYERPLPLSLLGGPRLLWISRAKNQEDSPAMKRERARRHWHSCGQAGNYICLSPSPISKSKQELLQKEPAAFGTRAARAPGSGLGEVERETPVRATRVTVLAAAPCHQKQAGEPWRQVNCTRAGHPRPSFWA